MKKRFLIPALLSVLLVAVLSLIPFEESCCEDDFSWDKLVHACMYFVLTIAVLRPAVRTGIKYPYLMIFFVLVLFGIGMEIIQYYLPYRSFELKDILFNILGCAGGCVLYFFTRLKTGCGIK